ncbi:MAG: PBP1A family penicillin-binding protein [Spirochaetia bacterium]
MRIRRRRRVVLATLISLAVVLAVSIGVTVGVAVASVKNIREIGRSAETESALPSVLLDRNGRTITELFGDEKRTLVSIEDLPRHLIHALVTREDQPFFEHGGFSLWNMTRAAVNIGLNVVTGGRAGYFSGASTITQQLAKMMYTDQSVTISRKIKELWWSLQLERHLTKFEILDEYLNRMAFGHGTYGVEAASQFYFGHTATELTVAESVLLVLQLSSPGSLSYSPIANPEDAQALQRQILDEMVGLGYATQAEVDQSFQEYWANHDYTRSATTAAFLERLDNDPAPWFSEHVRIRLQEELLLGSANINTDGYRVYTTLDLDYQDAAQRYLWEGIKKANETYRRNQVNNEERVERFIPMIDLLALAFDIEEFKVGTERAQARAANYFREEMTPLIDAISMFLEFQGQDPLRQVTRSSYLEGRQLAQRTTVEGALITIENETGNILAMVGGSPFESRNQNNRAISAFRPPGSSFKPLYYSAGIDSGLITPATVYMDSPVVFPNIDGTLYIPENYNGEWRGPTRVRYALATSMNVVSLKVFDDIGFTDALNNAGRLLGLNETEMAERGFEPRYPVGLGTVSLSPLLQARAFATFPNGGREVVPISVRFIEDRRGTEILNPAQEVFEQLNRKGDDAQIISPQAAYIMTSILQSTVEFGTLRNRRILVGGFGDMAMAGKTGTTQNWSDAWTVGFSPYMTTAVWLGFDRGGTNSLGTNQTGAQTAGPIWAWYMKEIHETLPPREFERPPGIVDVTITEESGLLPTEDYRGVTIEEIFIAGTEPTKFDTTEDFHDTRGARIAAEYSRTSSGGNSVATRLRELGLLSGSDRTSTDPGTSTFQGTGNPYLEDRPDDPGGDSDDGDPTEDEPNPMLD